MGGVEKPISKPQFVGESGPVRRPTRGDTLGNPFLNETANPNATSVKGGEMVPATTRFGYARIPWKPHMVVSRLR
jgi:hypothetical protein